MTGAVLLGGCTAARVTMVSPDTASVAAADLSTGSERAVRHRALTAAARAAHDHGYAFFAVLAVQDRVSSDGSGPVRNLPNPGNTQFERIPTRDLSSRLLIRFLNTSDLPTDRDGIYEVARLIPS